MDYEQSAPEDTRSAEELAHRLQAFADSLVTKRKEAIEAKKTSGMDEEWDELEAYYDGCESKGQRWDKAKTLTGPLMTSVPVDPPTEIPPLPAMITFVPLAVLFPVVLPVSV